MPKITVNSIDYTEISEGPGRSVYTNASTANTSPFTIELRNNRGKNKNSAMTCTIQVRNLVPYSEQPALTESIAATVTLRYQPNIVYNDKDAKINSVITVLSKLLGSDVVLKALSIGATDISGATIA